MNSENANRVSRHSHNGRHMDSNQTPPDCKSDLAIHVLRAVSPSGRVGHGRS
jgi:hypothetical protein